MSVKEDKIKKRKEILATNDLNKLLEDYSELADRELPGTNLARTKIYSLGLTKLTGAVIDASQSNESLSKRLFVLNIIFGLWTIGGAIVGLYAICT